MELFLDTANVDEIREGARIKTKVMAASIRHPPALRLGGPGSADISTMPFGVFKQMMNHPLADSGRSRFLKDWERASF